MTTKIKHLITSLLLFSLTFLCSFFVKATEVDSIASKRELILRGGVQYGKVFEIYNTYLYHINSGLGVNRFHSFTLQALWQTNGSKQWEQDYGMPRLGIGTWTARFYDNPILGNPIAIYGIFNAPFIRREKWRWNYEFDCGLTFNWKEFHPFENKQNIAIGSDISSYVELGTYFEYDITPKLSLELGFSFSHFSNGALKLPNLGVNTASPKILIQYRPSETEYHKEVKEKTPVPKNWEIQLQAYGGIKNVLYYGDDTDSITKFKGVYYPHYGFSTLLNKNLNRKSKIGLGLCFGYNGSANHNVFAVDSVLKKENASLKEGFELSIFPSYELMIDRVSVTAQLGYYLHRNEYPGMFPRLYQKLGMKYHLTSNFFGAINMKAFNFFRLEYIEWTLGYIIKI